MSVEQRDRPISRRSASLRFISSLREYARRRRSASPFFTWLQRNLQRERRVVISRIIVLMRRSHSGTCRQPYVCPLVGDVMRSTTMRFAPAN
jgi:hypothetical protein